MYRTWQHLIIENETGLQDRKRIRKLTNSSGSIGWLVVGGFLTGGIVSVLLAIFLFQVAQEMTEKQLSLISSGVLVLVLGGGLFTGAWLFWREMNLNTLRVFLKHPDEFVFIKGHLEECHYLSAEKRQQDRVVVEGRAIGPAGERIFIREEFNPRIWNFTTPEAERSLSRGSDWYDKKGTRKLLPVPAYFIYQKREPSRASLIAIESQYLNGSSNRT